MLGFLVIASMLAFLWYGEILGKDARADGPRSEVVLAESAIDSSMEKMARDSIQAGYVRPVDLYGKTQGTFSGITAKRKRATGQRITHKLASGFFSGTCVSFLFGTLVASSGSCSDAFCGYGGLYGALLGYPVGAAVGVNVVDPYDHFLPILGGSVGGLALGGVIFRKSSKLGPLIAIIVGPIVGATYGSELFRHPPGSRPLFSRTEDRVEWRIANKVGVGFLSGLALGSLSAITGSETATTIMYVMGAPIGINMVDSADRFAYSLAGAFLELGQPL